MKPEAGRKQLCLVGATGLVGSTVMREAVARSDIRLTAIARREAALPEGARMEMLVAPVEGWADAIASVRAHALVCALGTTIAAVDGDQAAFRAIDFDLVLATARAAKAAGMDHMIVVSSAGASTTSRSFYLHTKAEMEVALAALRFRRLDILRPGLLLGPRTKRRTGERLAQLASPLLALVLHGRFRAFRGIRATTVAQAIFALAHERPAGRFVHDNTGMAYAVRRREINPAI